MFFEEFPNHPLKPSVARLLVEVIFLQGEYQEAYSIAVDVRRDMVTGSKMRDIPDFISSLERIRDCDVEWLLPSHGPIFRKDPEMIQKTIDRLKTYLHMADFGTCATDWPLLDEWDTELLKGFRQDQN